MNHTPEFSQPKNTAAAEQHAKELAQCYARVFLGNEDGKRVLADLRAKFGLHRLVFIRNDRGQIDVNGGLLRDGQRHVMSDIEEALKMGAPSQALATKPNP